MRDIKVQHVAGAGGGLRIRDGHLIWREFTIPYQPGDTPPDPGPEYCCHDDPGPTLYDASADLVAFFDKWFGAGNKSEVDGYYEWDNATCGRSNFFRVPTDATLDDAIAAICDDPALLIDPFNTLRDTIVYMTRSGYLRGEGTQQPLKRRPRFSFVSPAGAGDCYVSPRLQYYEGEGYRSVLESFVSAAVFTPTKPCDDPQPCNVSGSNRTWDTRANLGEKICRYHTDEIATIVDDIMTNGVIEFQIEYRAAGLCTPLAGKICEEETATVWNEDPSCAACPGPLDTQTTTGTNVDAYSERARTSVVKRLNDCGDGTEFLHETDFDIRYSGTCADSGLTNLAAIDPRFTTLLQTTWTNYHFEPPSVADLCPSVQQIYCMSYYPFAYGELA